ncbi:helix-hairpin-helix domain-containing protein [Cellulosimicrobium protaetiae]|uniref:Helix-hairpin-helix DNA-binding motif class 1 domain-containing protein n=1 Tax=Cellulosimicrobium protaetiae TaxID=2587808 RepID=A0A6M5UEH1_9MICO|nr:helix-hairpin-helix domain-containing protein [Cellulosimicrobium protaetiae]QJW36414.1 hypothetical protein FIC82_009650 [Cellulosimicrobium protaetiae]
MSTPRHEPRQHARPGRDPARESAVVRQRLRAVAGTGRPALAWHPATAALPTVSRADADARPVHWDVPHPAADDIPWRGALGLPTDAPHDRAEASEPGEAAVGRGSEARRVERTGWLPERPGAVDASPAHEPVPGHDPALRHDLAPDHDPLLDHDSSSGHDREPGDGSGLVPGRRQQSEPSGARPSVGARPGSAEAAVDRLRYRAAATAASAYTAAHGHPTAHSGFADLGEEGRPRWGLRPRVAVAALVVVLALAAGVVLLRSPVGGVEPMARLDVAGAGAVATGPGSEAGAAGGTGGTDAAPDGGETGSPDAGDGTPVPTAGDPGAEVVVHVVGQVAAPGLVKVAAKARVADALEAAGGATPEADLAALNLARTVTDGEQIVVPRPGEAVPAPAPASGAVAGTAGAPVDLNAADAAALDALPGIGPVLAERIVAWRTENGPFTTVDELGEVSGIGPAVLADVRDLVRV